MAPGIFIYIFSTHVNSRGRDKCDEREERERRRRRGEKKTKDFLLKASRGNKNGLGNTDPILALRRRFFFPPSIRHRWAGQGKTTQVRTNTREKRNLTSGGWVGGWVEGGRGGIRANRKRKVPKVFSNFSPVCETHSTSSGGHFLFSGASRSHVVVGFLKASPPGQCEESKLCACYSHVSL